MLDHAAMGLALVGQSAPTFFLGILFILLISVKAGLLAHVGTRRLATTSCCRR